MLLYLFGVLHINKYLLSLLYLVLAIVMGYFLLKKSDLWLINECKFYVSLGSIYGAVSPLLPHESSRVVEKHGVNVSVEMEREL